MTRLAVVGLACAAVAQLATLQAPALAASPKTTAVKTSAVQCPSGTGTAPVKVARPKMQLGAGIDLYTYPKQNWTTASVADVAYLKAMHANSVMVSFPFFLTAKKATTVYAKPSTPTPADLAQFAVAAEKAGIYVTLRPLMDQQIIGESRAGWKPTSIAAFMKSYQAFLLPYVAMAKACDVPAFYLGAEFSQFQMNAAWKSLRTALHAVYGSGTLLYANNGPGIRKGVGGGVLASVDAYPDLDVPWTSTVARLVKGWTYMDKHLPAHNVLSEVGIAGVRGAYWKPWEHHWPHPVMDINMQIRWFTAACDAALDNKLNGIYFWAIGFGTDELQQTLTPQNQAAWEKGAAETAIAACYKHIESLPISKQ